MDNNVTNQNENDTQTMGVFQQELKKKNLSKEEKKNLSMRRIFFAFVILDGIAAIVLLFAIFDTIFK